MRGQATGKVPEDSTSRAIRFAYLEKAAREVGHVGFAEFVNHWWNLPFLVMLGLVVVFFALQTPLAVWSMSPLGARLSAPCARCGAWPRNSDGMMPA